MVKIPKKGWHGHFSDMLPIILDLFWAIWEEELVIFNFDLIEAFNDLSPFFWLVVKLMSINRIGTHH